MDPRDRAFLDELVQFTTMNHVAAVRLYRRGLTDLNGVAMLTEGALRPYSSREALAEAVVKNKDAARIERILIAKMFAELMSAYEDLGALGHAIRQRAKGGIFYQYLISEPSEAANFLQVAYQSGPSAGLDALLKLPSLTALGHKRPDPDVLAAITVDYTDLPRALYDVAKMSLTPTGGIQQLGASGDVLPSWRDDLNILLNVDPPPAGASATTSSPAPSAGNSPARRRRGQKVGAAQGATLVGAFNKIKHRFTVSDNLPGYVSTPRNGNTVYGRFGITTAFVDMLVNNTIVTAKVMGELAGLLIKLDEAKLRL